MARTPHGQFGPAETIEKAVPGIPTAPPNGDHRYSGGVTSVTSVTSEDDRPLWQRLESWSAPKLLAADFPPLRWAVPEPAAGGVCPAGRRPEGREVVGGVGHRPRGRRRWVGSRCPTGRDGTGAVSGVGGWAAPAG